MDRLEATLLAMLIPCFAFTVWALWGAAVDEHRQRFGWTDKYNKRWQPVNGSILKAARARLWVYVALASAQGFMLLLGLLAALAANGPERSRSWQEWAIISVFVALAALTTGSTVAATFIWRSLVRDRQAQIEATERIRKSRHD
jgi:hypothetical protein